MGVIHNPIHSDLAYLLLENASHGAIRVQTETQLSTATRLVMEGFMDEDPMTGRLIITEAGRALLPKLKERGYSALNGLTAIPKRGPKPSIGTLEKRILAQGAEVQRWKKIAEIRQRVNQRLVKINRHLTAYTGTDIHIIALRVQVEEQKTMINGLRQTIERLKAERDGRD